MRISCLLRNILKTSACINCKARNYRRTNSYYDNNLSAGNDTLSINFVLISKILKNIVPATERWLCLLSNVWFQCVWKPRQLWCRHCGDYIIIALTFSPLDYTAHRHAAAKRPASLLLISPNKGRICAVSKLDLISEFGFAGDKITKTMYVTPWHAPNELTTCR